ncbi:hypothetical protein D3C84_805160 [compost metagenome]
MGYGVVERRTFGGVLVEKGDGHHRRNIAGSVLVREDKMIGRQAVHQVARQRHFETVAIGVGGEILEVGAVARSAVGHLQRAVQAIAQGRVAERRDIDLVGGHVEIEDLVTGAGGSGAVAVEF